METETTLSLAESAEEILSLIKTRDIIQENLKSDHIMNSYLVMVIFNLETAIKNLAYRVTEATR
jgi:hypothetical protein